MRKLFVCKNSDTSVQIDSNTLPVRFAFRRNVNLEKDGEKLSVNVSLSILSFGRIDENNESFHLRFLLKLKW